MTLDKNAIFAINDSKSEMIDMPEWGGQVKIKTMSAGDLFTFNDWVEGQKNKENQVFKLIVMCCVNDDDSAMFTDDDIPQLEKKASEPIMRLFTAIMDLNKTKGNVVEDMAKNSSGVLSDDSPLA